MRRTVGYYIVRCRWCGELWQADEEVLVEYWRLHGCPHCQIREQIRMNALLVRSFSDPEWAGMMAGI